MNSSHFVVGPRYSPAMAVSSSIRTEETLLEAAFPHSSTSSLVRADRRARDGVYRTHRWFARRPAPLLRSMLLAAVTPAATSVEGFWEAYRAPETHLAGISVHDPFLGGSTTLIEASRLGADCSGSDIDPLAVLIGRHAAAPPSLKAFDTAADELLEHLRQELGHIYPWEGEPLPIHTFSVAEVTCPSCDARSPLYRSLVLSRGANRVGSVARKPGVTVFCPDCYSVHELGPKRTILVCCGKRRRLDVGTFSSQRFRCPHCGVRAMHKELQTGISPRALVAVEETYELNGRVIRAISEADRSFEVEAEAFLRNHPDLPLPTASINVARTDERPVSFGFQSYRELFSYRQLALFGTAFAWISERRGDERTTRALTLAVSNALATNNRLCGYAVEYGRLSALFSVRGYSLPAVAVELNALHPTAGRGTIPRVLGRIRASLAEDVRRYVFVPGERTPVAETRRFPSTRNADVALASATEWRPKIPGRTYDLIVTDPPYFDFIPYDELSAFYRSWLPQAKLAGEALHPPGSGDRVNAFGLRLGQSLRNSVAALSPTGMLIFTYHSSNPAAWRAVAIALDEAKLRVTALWPVLADPHMGHHGTAGACEYDLILVTRPIMSTRTAAAPFAHAEDPSGTWLAWLGLELSEVDQANVRFAYDACAPRWGAGVPRSGSPTSTALVAVG
jgi:putative DNA methylase